MTYLQRVWEALEAGLWRFTRLIHNANHDLPYHDFVTVDNTQGSDPISGSYAVGTNNVDAHGDQTKRFVSKRANIWATDSNMGLHFNDSRNVAILLPMTYYEPVSETGVYQKEFYTNIAVVYYSVPVGGLLLMYFEGVLSEEARDAE